MNPLKLKGEIEKLLHAINPNPEVKDDDIIYWDDLIKAHAWIRKTDYKEFPIQVQAGIFPILKRKFGLDFHKKRIFRESLIEKQASIR